MANMLWIFAFCLASVLHASNAEEMCGYKYCEHGCCDYSSSECCDEVNVAAIIGLVVGVIVVIVFIVIIIIVCRRRRHNGIVYRSQPGNQTVVVQQGVSANNGFVTQGMQPGVVYPPYQPYAPQPGYPQPMMGQAYPPPAPGQAYPPPTHAQGPPSYESLQQDNPPQAYPGASGGLDNRGFNEQK
ncbi:hypothetical protein EGW08_000718 [Elysia chlorotica]|uniref:Cysteine and tyrosine-rich protein 1 n=1 Tax=Elysia chlorotica TaxID=188477 RepID=A0A433UC94_ELYCH|nr:hypothetical protein EGW08_000718 [Elysia chlorotica]